MSIVFLQAINAVLTRVGEIAGDSDELATSTVTSTATGLTATEAFTDSRRQHKINIAIQLWNEVTHEIYSMGLMAAEAASATLTLASGTREYSLPDDFERMAGDEAGTRAIRGATTGLLVYEYQGGYAKMLVDQMFPSDYVGDPTKWAFSPVGRTIRFDYEPGADQAGDTYNFLYEKRLSLTSTMATSTLPFSDTVADSLVPVVAEAYDRIIKKEYSPEFLAVSLTRALRHLTQNQPKDRWGVNCG